MNTDTTSCVSYFDSQTSCFIWKIKQYQNLFKYGSETLFESGYFNIKDIGSQFYLTVCPTTSLVSLNSTKYMSSFRLFCQLYLINASGKRAMLANFSSLYSGKNLDKDIKIFALSKLIEEDFLPEGTLTLCLDIGRVENVVSTGIVTNSNIQSGNGTLRTAFTKLFEEKKETDIVLRVGEDEIKAHKLVLMCRSEVFAAMMDHDMREKKTNEVNIEDVDFGVMCALVRFLYTDQVDCRDVTFSLKLLVAADKYDVALLRDHCALYISKNIVEKNVFQVLKIANALNESHLVKCCKDFIERMSPISFWTEFQSQKALCPEIADVIDLLKSKSVK